jgi:hypothetical protein
MNALGKYASLDIIIILLISTSLIASIGLFPTYTEPALYFFLTFCLTITCYSRKLWIKSLFPIVYAISIYKILLFLFFNHDYNYTLDPLRVYVILTIISTLFSVNESTLLSLIKILEKSFFILAITFFFASMISGNHFTSQNAEDAIRLLGLKGFINETTFAYLMLWACVICFRLFLSGKTFYASFMLLICVADIFLLAKAGHSITVLLLLITPILIRLRVFYFFLIMSFCMIIYFLFFYDHSQLPLLDIILSYRGTIWESTFSDFYNSNIQSRLFGLGLEYTTEVLEPFSDEKNYIKISIHSAFIRLLVQEGIIGFIIYMSILFYLFSFAYKKSSAIGKRLFPYIITVFFFSKISDGSLFYKTSYYFEFLLVFILLIPKLTNNEKSISTNFR